MRFVKRDAVHRAIVEAFRACGCSVYDAAHAGGGFPDLVVGLRGQTYLVELKTGKGKLTEGQETFAREWRGSPVVVLRTVVDAVDFVANIRRA